MITEQDVREFQKLYKTRFKRDMSDENAKACLAALVKQVEVLFMGEHKNVNEHRGKNGPQRTTD